MEPRIEADLGRVRAGHRLPAVMRAKVSLPIGRPIVPHEGPPLDWMHAQGSPILLLQPIEGCGAPACPGWELPSLQISKDCSQASFATSAASGLIIVMVAFVLLPMRIRGGLQWLETVWRHPSDSG